MQRCKQAERFYFEFILNSFMNEVFLFSGLTQTQLSQNKAEFLTGYNQSGGKELLRLGFKRPNVLQKGDLGVKGQEGSENETSLMWDSVHVLQSQKSGHR